MLVWSRQCRQTETRPWEGFEELPVPLWPDVCRSRPRHCYITWHRVEDDLQNETCTLISGPTFMENSSFKGSLHVWCECNGKNSRKIVLKKQNQKQLHYKGRFYTYEECVLVRMVPTWNKWKHNSVKIRKDTLQHSYIHKLLLKLLKIAKKTAMKCIHRNK